MPFNNDSNDDKQTNTLKNARIKHPKKVCLSHININSIRNKLDSLFEFTYGLVDFLAVSETKLDSSFPTGQINLPGFRTPFRKDLSGKSGGLLVYVNSNIPSKMLKIPDCPNDIQVIPVEINLKKQKWLVIAIYIPPSQCKNYSITELTKILDKCRESYENTVILGDFNMKPANQILETILEDNSSVNLIKFNTCFKSKPGSCIDLILTNRPKGFQNSGVMETGISDHHALIFSFLKSTFTKMPPNKLQYRNYKKFEVHSFLHDVEQLPEKINYTEWEKDFVKTLNKHAPLKTKVIRRNHKSFITKNLRKAIMKRSALKKRANFSNNPEIIKLYKKQRNYVVNLSRKVKTEYFQKHMPHGASSKNFWKFCKPFSSNKTTNFDDKIILVEKGEVVSKNEEIATHFNNYFNDITKGLNIKKWCIPDDLSDDPLMNAIRKYENHPSIIKIKSSVETTQLFDFNFGSSDDICKIINSLDPTKKTSGAIPTKIVKLTNKQICKDLANCINECIKQNKFPNELKIADITPILKKDDPLDKTNYRPISILPTASKIFERILFNQLQRFSNKILWPLLCGFRKGYSTQYALINLLQKWQKCLDASDGIVGTLLMNLSKVYDCVNHDLIIAKLEAYGVGENSLRLIQDYLSQRQQRVKVGSSLSEWLEIILGVPQGSILGPILFNVFINDLLLFIKETDISNFADDANLYACGKESDTISFKLEIETSTAIQWLKDNEMVANPSKFQLMFLSKYKIIEKKDVF